jgi:hypothetical protein
MRFPKSILMLFFSAILLGCGSDDNGPTGPSTDPGTFSITITGDVNSSFTGSAIFVSSGADPLTGTAGFMTVCSSIDPQTGWGVWVGRPGAQRPGTGSYDVSAYENDPETTWQQDLTPGDIYILVSHANTIYISQTGGITVTTSSANRFAGSFQITAESLDVGSGEVQVIQVEGIFDALGSPAG